MNVPVHVVDGVFSQRSRPALGVLTLCRLALFGQAVDAIDSDDDNGAVVCKILRTARAPQVSLWECDYLPVADVDKLIRANMAEVEAKKPWRFVFRCLKVPFNFKRINDPFDVFFMRWGEFWLVHGRAVWERDFWQPLVPGSTEYYRRKWRQTRVQCAFRELATDLVQRLGRIIVWPLARR
ncbi:hypothetical protein GQ600_19032 [Phytophthora cactorum]|nr:hypothetical protein GQ600_19032 [Phytophthora cactorum]